VNHPGRRERKYKNVRDSLDFGVLVASIFSFNTQAFPGASAPQLAGSDVLLVRGFCGLGFHRGPYGACVPNGVPYGYVAPVVVAPYAAPVVVAPRITCPYGYYYYGPTAAACPLRDGGRRPDGLLWLAELEWLWYNDDRSFSIMISSHD